MGRESYLVEGRRVTVADLVELGYLKTGARLIFHRPRVGETHRAEVRGDGTIQLPNGRIYPSPSRAAAAAVGRGSFDGWHAWSLDDGRTLDQIRQKFLDDVATDVSDRKNSAASDENLSSSAKRHEWLKQARRKADDGEPTALTVRDLMSWWGVQRRGYVVTKQIHADLDNHGLATTPEFDKVHVDALVRVVSAAQEGEDDAEGQAAPDADTEFSEEALPDDDDNAAVALTVGNLPSALAGVTSIPPDGTFEQAITLMAINDYSQLPVISGRTLRGAVTWKSIARTRHARADASFSDAIIRPRDVPYDHDLVDILPELAEHEFILVRDQTQTIAGIITASDVAMAYGSMASPFLLIGELDQRLRRTIAQTFDLAQVVELCDPQGRRNVISMDALTMGDYQRMLEHPPFWDQLGWSLDRKIFTKRLGEIRAIRNDVMHFNPDPLPEDAVKKIRYIITLLREYGA
jgi:CBS domain-containing protein